MELTSKTLKEHNFELVEQVLHDELSSFLLRQNWKYSQLHLIYLISILVSILLMSSFFILSSVPMLNKLLFAGLGVAIAFLIIPIHEYIHYWTFKYLGAKKVVVKIYFRRGYILTHADQFIVGKKEIKWIALMPFVCISALCLVLLLMSNNQWQIILSSTILFHTSICSADFRILDYFLSNNSEIVMIDDVEKGINCIYKRIISDI